MLRQSIIYLLLSILIVIFAESVHLLIVYIDIFYNFVNLQLMPIFSNTDTGIMMRKVLCLVFIPVIIAAVPALIYRLIKGSHMPYFIQLTWFLWLVLVLSKVLIR